MDKYNFVTVDVHTNGVVRLYGDGGFLHEIKGDYVTVNTRVDALPTTPSGQIPKKKPVDVIPPEQFMVGDRVKVVKVVKHETEWVNGDMDAFIGQTFTIDAIDPQHGVSFGIGVDYQFPPSCLEQV
jgi:hypothetical protein